MTSVRGKYPIRSCSRAYRQLDVDPIVVERLTAGYDVTNANYAEVDAAFRILIDRGVSALEVARITGFSSRTVQRHKANWRREAG